MKNSRLKTLNTFKVRNAHFLISIPLKQVSGHKRKLQTIYTNICALRKSSSKVVASIHSIINLCCNRHTPERKWVSDTVVMLSQAWRSHTQKLNKNELNKI